MLLTVALATLLPIPAAAQNDPRLQAQYEIAAILQSARHPWQSPLGWQEDVFSVSFQVRGPCESTITRT